MMIGVYKEIVGQGQTIKVIAQLEKVVPYGVDWKQSPDDRLSEEIQSSGLQFFKVIMSTIKEHSKRHEPENTVTDRNIDIIAIGTEVFRKAKNGEEFLKRVESESDLKNELISHDMEAELGYLTGEAAVLTIDKNDLSLLNPLGCNNKKDLAVYDSGGGSSQITWKNQKARLTETSSHTNCANTLNKVLKASGLASTLTDLLALQNKDPKDSPNPVSYKTSAELIDNLIRVHDIRPEKMKQLATHGCQPMFLSFGGMNSHARLATDVLLRMQIEEHVTDVKSSLSARSDEYTVSKETPKYYVLTRETVKLALKRICDKEDKELKIYSMYPNAEPASYMVPKLCMLLSV